MHARRLALTFAAGTVIAFLAASSAAGTPPCPAFDYRVTFADPVCSAVLLRDSNLALSHLFWLNDSSGGYVAFADLVRPAPSEAEPVTFLDADTDGMASASDAFQVWTPGGCGSSQLIVYMGANATSIGGSQGLFLREGYVLNCMGSGADPNLPILVAGIGIAGLAAVGVAVVWILSRRRP